MYVCGLQDSSSVIQFVTRGHVQLDDRAVEVSNGLPEEISVRHQINPSIHLKNTFVWDF